MAGFPKGTLSPYRNSLSIQGGGARSVGGESARVLTKSIEPHGLVRDVLLHWNLPAHQISLKR